MDHKLKYSVKASEVASWLGLTIRGEDYDISNISSLKNICDGSLCFSSESNSVLTKFNAKAIVIATESNAKNCKCILVSNSPRLDFARLLHQLNLRIGFVRETSPPNIHPSASVSSLSFIGNGVNIGERSVILPFAYIGDGTHIGSDCLIKSGAIIGQDGFGFERDENDIPLRLIHLGNVFIANNVEIGSLTTICRGTLDNTIINEHAKIDDHVHISHNVNIGKGAMVVACAEISGGVCLGDFSWVGPNSSIIQKTYIGNRAFVGIGSNVLTDVADGVVVAGNPAREISKKNP